MNEADCAEYAQYSYIKLVLDAFERRVFEFREWFVLVARIRGVDNRAAKPSGSNASCSQSQSRRILELFSSSSPSALLFSLESEAHSISQTVLVFSCQAVLKLRQAEVEVGAMPALKGGKPFSNFLHKIASPQQQKMSGALHCSQNSILEPFTGSERFFPWNPSKIASVALVRAYSLCGIQE